MKYNYIMTISLGAAFRYSAKLNAQRCIMKRKIKAIAVACILVIIINLNMHIIAKARSTDTYSDKYIIDTQELPEALTYEELSQLYSCNEDVRVTDSAIIEIDYEDAVRLMKVAQAEAGENDPVAIAYVMMIIINRWKDDYWPNTIDGVLSQSKQFTVYKSERYENTIPNANAHIALYLVESGQISIEAEYYEATYVKNSWQSRNRELEFEYEGHRFYK